MADMQPLVRDNIRLAATVMLVRDGDHGLEVYMVQRPGRGDFPDLHVFPGGKVDEEDWAPELCVGFDDGNRIFAVMPRVALGRGPGAQVAEHVIDAPCRRHFETGHVQQPAQQQQSEAPGQPRSAQKTQPFPVPSQ